MKEIEIQEKYERLAKRFHVLCHFYGKREKDGNRNFTREHMNMYVYWRCSQCSAHFATAFSVVDA